MVVCESPTLSELIRFTGTVLSDRVLLAWETASERNTAGFYIRRKDRESGEEITIPQTLIAATGSASSGASYTYEDRSIVAGKTYIYILEEVEVSGTSHQFAEDAVELSMAAATPPGGGSVTP